MKRIYAFLLLAFGAAQAQIVNIPDPAFKAKLLSASPANGIANNSAGDAIAIDINNNGEIEVSEAAEVASLSISDSGISDLTGIVAFTSLSALNCSHNQLTEIDTSQMSTYMSVFDCSYNQLETVNLPGGEFVNCSHNQLTSITFLSGSFSLDCSYNHLSHLELTYGIDTLNCSYNELTSLVFGNVELSGINASHNQLTTIDTTPAFWTLLYLDVQDNALESLFLSNVEILFDLSDFSGNDDLAYICIGTSQLEAAQNMVDSLGYSAEVNSFCYYEPGAFYHISGVQRVDADNNGCSDADTFFPHLKFDITNGSDTASFIADGEGIYDIPVQAGTYTVTPVGVNPHFASVPVSAQVAFPDAGLTAMPQFCISKNGIHHDLQTQIIPLNFPLPGFDAEYRMTISNVGTESEIATVTFSYDEATLDFGSAIPAPTILSPGLLGWTVNLNCFGNETFDITLNLNSPAEIPPLNLGNVLTFSGTASVGEDATPADNTFTLHQTVVNALDPNDKTCLEGNTIGPEMAGKYLHYLIRFENTGNYPAQNVRVEDLIDTTKFEIESLEPLDGSHAFVTRITGNKVEFIFNNIMLPFDDANNDGWVLFRIKTKPTLVLGDSVSNTAGIYFNFNPPIITNTATTTFATMGVDSNFDRSFTLWPNPANDVVNVTSKRGEVITSVSIYNTIGQELLRQEGSDIRSMNISTLAAGTYVVTVVAADSKSSTQFIKR